MEANQTMPEVKPNLESGINRNNIEFLPDLIFQERFGGLPEKQNFRNYMSDKDKAEAMANHSVLSFEDEDRYVLKYAVADMFLERFFKEHSDIEIVSKQAYVIHNFNDSPSREEMLASMNRIDSGIFVHKDMVFEFLYEDFSPASSDFVLNREVLIARLEQPFNTEFEKNYMESVNTTFDKTKNNHLNYVFGMRIYIRPGGYTQEIHDFVEGVCKMMSECTYLIRSVVKPKRASVIQLLTLNQGQLSLSERNIEAPVLNVDIQYNNDFRPIHDKIAASLETEGSGLILLHGVPGSGKTTYIKHLMHMYGKKRRVIYLPPAMTDALSNPNFMQFLMQNTGSVLVIEDAENALKDRSAGGNQAVSNLLNLSDGILGDVLKIQIITTFNCEVSQIDSALMRKGRLTAMYEFKELAHDKAIALAKILNKDESLITGDTILTNVYNLEDDSYVKERKTIGFEVSSPEVKETVKKPTVRKVTVKSTPKTTTKKATTVKAPVKKKASTVKN